MKGASVYQLIAVDLDETLVGHDGTICQRNVDAVRAAREQGARVVVATGRGYTLAHSELRRLDLFDQPNEYTISFNGGAITENAGERLLYFDGLGNDLGAALFAEGERRGICTHVYTKDQLYIINIDDFDAAQLDGKIPFTAVDWTDLAPLHGQEIAKVLFMSRDMDYLHELEQELATITGDASATYSSNRYLEYNHKGVNKGSGLLRLADMLGIPREQTIAVGDNPNDLPMLRAAGLGVGVANVLPSMRDDCDYICEADCDEGGVAEVIEKFILSA